MTSEDSADITGLLVAWNNGDEKALSDLIAAIYPELRRIARHCLRRRLPGQTLESAALANEAYLRLVRARGIECESRSHFLALCARIIRRILVDYTRGKHYAKRGGTYPHVPMDEALFGTTARGVEMASLDDALTLLAKIDPRKGQVVELRYFGGLTIEECSEVLKVSPETVMRDWKMAKTWLFRELGKKG